MSNCFKKCSIITAYITYNYCSEPMYGKKLNKVFVKEYHFC